MKNNLTASILVFLSWPTYLVHRLLNNSPPHVIRWIVFDKSVSMDVQWFVHDVCDIISSILLIFGAWIATKKEVHILLGAMLIISFIDLAHYLLWYKRNEYVLWVESGVIFGAMALIFKNHVTR